MNSMIAVLTLLLGAVTAAGNHLDVAQCRHEVFEIGEELIRSGERHHEVAVASDAVAAFLQLYLQPDKA
jgi:hypothetical protein